MLRTAAFAVFFTPTLSFAQEMPADVTALAEAVQMSEIIEVIVLEGLAYGEQIEADLFGGTAPADWTVRVAEIYDAQVLTDAIMEGFAEALMGEDIAPMTAFYTSDPGATIAQLELDARRARLDPDVEQASIESAALAAMEETPRIGQIGALLDANDLIESNVVAAMNFNYAFYLGLVEGGAMGGNVTESQILADVWGQEETIRAQTGEWFYSFYHLALQPVSDADVDAYVAFAQTEAGQALDQALVEAFEPVFLEISRALGLSAGEMMMFQEL